MPTAKKTADSVSKKHVQQEIETELATTLNGLKHSFGEKKLKKRIKKAAKFITHGLPKKIVQDQHPKKSVKSSSKNNDKS